MEQTLLMIPTDNQRYETHVVTHTKSKSSIAKSEMMKEVLSLAPHWPMATRRSKCWKIWQRCHKRGHHGKG